VSAANCTSCISSSLSFQNQCYSSCPSNAPYSNGSSCTTCNIVNCIVCSSSSCGTCNAGYLLILGTSCIANCNTNYTYNSTSLDCQQITTNTTNSTNTTTTNTTTTSISDSGLPNFVPLPYLMVSLIYAGTIGLSMLIHDKVKFIHAFLPIVSLLNICSCTTNIIVFIYSNQPTSFKSFLSILSLKDCILIMSLMFVLGMNLIHQGFICVYLN
jgi:hypothetical protein